MTPQWPRDPVTLPEFDTCMICGEPDAPWDPHEGMFAHADCINDYDGDEVA